jgi:tungstate transport system substrate-binding protein
MGEEGNADVLLVHAPTSEKEFMENNFGSKRYLVMHNDFVIVGPPQDPGQISGMSSPVKTFEKIATIQATFISRGDDSGTHKKERSIWERANHQPQGDWYLETGQGMGATLRIVSEKEAYTLTDRSTFLAQREMLNLEVMVEDDPTLLNVYHVMTVNPDLWPEVNAQGAQILADFLVSPKGQEIIGSFGIDTFGEPLFVPDAGKTESELGLET